MWEWLQLAGREFRVFGAQLTIDDVLDDEVEFDEVALPQLSLERLNDLAATVEAELQASGYDAELEAVQIEEKKAAGLWAKDAGLHDGTPYYEAAIACGVIPRTPAPHFKRLTRAQHETVMAQLREQQPQPAA